MASLMVGALPMTHPSPLLSASRLSTPHSEFQGVSLCCYATASSRSLSATTSLPSSFSIVRCGRGDKKTAKGKRFRHSFGNSRPRSKLKGRGPPRIPLPSAPAKKELLVDEEEEVEEEFSQPQVEEEEEEVE
ncbi:hypothetical protein Tsubulata_033709 [Turnera subulata]|uniref:30S ribosomal protein n=1 Tax=Turnera subulata TaxID=218843 RepID=A0A9Q0J8A6_9ROSI|nr:hypothetical protein Tsubulata_033709 [Turnera subulata]